MSESDNELKTIKERCVYFLARREHSQQELIYKLSKKGYLKQAIQQVIDELAAQGLQSDVRFAESYARSRVHKGFGPLHIQAELHARGAGGQHFDRAVEEIVGSWSLLLAQVYAKKYSDSAITLDDKERLKRSRFLQQRGFPMAMILTFFRQLAVH